MPFTPALSLHSGRFLRCVISYFLPPFSFCYPFQRAGPTGKAGQTLTVHMARITSWGNCDPPSPAWWPHYLTNWFLSICQCHSSQTPSHPLITISRGRTLLAGFPGWNLWLYQCEAPRYKFGETVLPRREHLASFSFHNTQKGWVQHRRQTGIWKRSNKDRETTLAPRKHAPEAAFFTFKK